MRGSLGLPHSTTPPLTSPMTEHLRKWLSNLESAKSLQLGAAQQIDELLKIDKFAQSLTVEQLKAALAPHVPTEAINPVKRSGQGSFHQAATSAPSQNGAGEPLFAKLFQ